MDPLALAAATLLIKASMHFGETLWSKFSDTVADDMGKAAGDAGWNLLGRMASRIRGWFKAHDDKDGEVAVEVAVAAPDSQLSAQKLATAIDRAIAEDDDLRRELQAFVDKGREAEGEVGQFSVQVWNNAIVGKIVQIGSIQANIVNL